MLFDGAKAGLSEDEVFVAGLLSCVLTRMPTEKHGYDALQTYIDLNTGGVSLSPSAWAKRYPSIDEYLPLFNLKLRLLPDKLKEIPNIIAELLTQTKFTAHDRLYELLKETKAQMDMSFQSDPDEIVDSCLKRVNSPMGAFLDSVYGLRFSRNLNAVLSNWKQSSEEDKMPCDAAKKLGEQMQRVCSKLFRPQCVTVLLTSEKRGLAAGGAADFLKACLASLCTTGVAAEATMPKNSSYYEQQMQQVAFKAARKPERCAYVTPTAVNYVGMAQNMVHCGAPELCGARLVTQHIVSYDYLWPNIRVMGGAYGAYMSTQKNGILTLTSYRDPRLRETMEAYYALPDFLTKLSKTPEEMELAIIGTIGEHDAPRSASASGKEAAFRYLSGYNDEWYQCIWEQMLSCTLDQIHEEGKHIGDAIKHADFIAAVSSTVAAANKDLFDAVETLIQ